jgi:cytochrome c oxidase subunit 1
MNRLSTVGAFILTAGLVAALWSLLVSLRASGRRAPPNPWGAASLEWATASPPPHENFEAPPRARKPYDFTGLRLASEAAGYVEEAR